MIYYLVDASVAVDFYIPKGGFETKDYKRYRTLKARIIAQKLQGKATLFLPSCCIAEVKNALARLYREGTFPKKASYDGALSRFVDHIHDRKLFYCYDLNRYHNLNADEVVKCDGKLPSGGKNRLSGFDVVVVSMGMELRRILGQQVHLLTGDKRMVEVCREKQDIFPRAYYWCEIEEKHLPGANI